MEDADFKRMARLDAAKRVYKSMHPGDFPKDELEVIPWVNQYEEYITHLHGEGHEHKVQHIKAHVPSRVQGFIENRNTWKDKKAAILNLTGPSAETVLGISKKLTQEPTEDAHKFCQRVLETCEKIGKTDNVEITNIFKDGLISGVREKITNLGQLQDINEIATQTQAAYQSFRISCDNSERLNALEARLIKQLGVNSAEQMKQLVSVLAVKEPPAPPATYQQMPDPIAYVNNVQFAGQATGYAATPNRQDCSRPVAAYSGPQLQMGQQRVPVQCWNCGGGHYKSGCPLLPRTDRHARGFSNGEQGQHSHGYNALGTSYVHMPKDYNPWNCSSIGPRFSNGGRQGTDEQFNGRGPGQSFQHQPRGHTPNQSYQSGPQNRGMNSMYAQEGDPLQAILDVINMHQGN